jgi:hypothetical protein
MDGTGLRFETMEHGGEYPNTMPQAIKWSMQKAAPAFTLPSRSSAKWSTAKATSSI